MTFSFDSMTDPGVDLKDLTWKLGGETDCCPPWSFEMLFLEQEDPLPLL
jgi:hypothetical protein